MNYANGGHTYYGFPSATQVITEQDQNTSGDRALQWETQYDGFGRLVESDTFEGQTQYIATTRSYDALGRISATTNPSRYTNGQGDGLGYTTTYSYDGLSRQTKVTTPEGAVTSTSYSSGYTTLTDAAGNSRRLQTDGLGRVANVLENPGGLGYQTTYTNAANNTLRKVTQGSQTRTFYYDSLGRLTGSAQPETGAINYSYDAVGNLTSKTDSRGATSTRSYQYDALNRLTQIGYSDNKTYTATLGYDASGVPNSTGHLTSVFNYTATMNYTNFDVMGNVLASTEITGGETYNFSYAYNLAGGLTGEAYPSGRVLWTAYDSANRVSARSGGLNGNVTPYIANVSYFPHGAPLGYQYGNNVWRGDSYNSRLQENCLWDTIALSTSAYLFTQCPFNWGTTNNNGNLQGVTAQAGGPGALGSLPAFTQTFSYDALNRLASAADKTGSTTNWSRTFAYDQYGNAWVPSADRHGLWCLDSEWGCV